MTVHQLISWAAFPRILQLPGRLPANTHTLASTQSSPSLCNSTVWQSQSLRGRAGITFYSEVLGEEAEEEEGAACQRGSTQETHAVPFLQRCLLKKTLLFSKVATFNSTKVNAPYWNISLIQFIYINPYNIHLIYIVHRNPRLIFYYYFFFYSEDLTPKWTPKPENRLWKRILKKNKES